jgi:hypothetical protein
VKSAVISCLEGIVKNLLKSIKYKSHPVTQRETLNLKLITLMRIKAMKVQSVCSA